ncbi:MAG: hypothetical protein DHS20C02_04040 [Micavibrio sp.]|nr:MAG: hypothetical protein DHS20C02_04040 [Micavibrio sp.]
MPLEYDLDRKLKELTPAMREHVAWFDAVISKVFYSESVDIKQPQYFSTWLEEMQGREILEVESLKGLQEMHDNLCDAGNALVDAASSGQKPDQDLFKSLTSLFEEFLNQLVKLERECLLENTGIDPLTGLRSRRALVRDLKKELDRFARNGRQFTVAIARIDEYPKIMDAFGEEKSKEYMMLVADLIKKSMRAFDDAYVFEDDKFVLCLKQSEVQGGLAALERLRHELEEEDVIINLGDSKMPLTMSCCVAEPQPDEKVDELLLNLKNDLEGTDHEGDKVLQYYEISPLERYVQTSEE